jgi:hypothetical protein
MHMSDRVPHVTYLTGTLPLGVRFSSPKPDLLRQGMGGVLDVFRELSGLGRALPVVKEGGVGAELEEEVAEVAGVAGVIAGAQLLADGTRRFMMVILSHHSPD